ncbi:DNA/RNA non-specific endonuclease [[Clostridium] fimetarium]|uniref:Type VII secretion system protein EssD-like domain-containing protein n=1 Tax=[Clostridium] fimetarium TaxID=99656 RepID=A0A1I0RDH4_9FIRM|nr:hypothetical protein [[Clostridium] fimetarium]SEW38716.1 hypothetical protein SAMN05421659_11428 [[Clostridium] fimetarium]
MKKIILWVLSVFFVLMSIGGFLSNFISGIFMLLVAIGCNPIFVNKLDKLGIRLKKRIYIPILIALFVFGATLSSNKNSLENNNENAQASNITENVENIASSDAEVENKVDVAESQNDTPKVVQPNIEAQQSILTNSNNTINYNGSNYKIIVVDGGNLSGNRQSNVAVDVGFGDRIYWGLTNEYSQLVYVIADKVTLQDPNTEKVLSSGRYYADEAKVSGTERSDLDEGHVIADSLGGVSNAYNITPQDSVLNRSGNQAYMEKVLRDAGGCTDFVATITYPDTATQIPSHYHYEYILKGNKVIDDFDNINPDKAIVTPTVASTIATIPTSAPISNSSGGIATPVDEKIELNRVDTNKNGKVTIAEAKAAGYAMPIYSKDWLYKYMTDADGDGVVGE